MIEVWKDVPNYEGMYQVSNLGNVKSLDKIVSHYPNGTRLRKGKVLKQQKLKSGYLIVSINNKSKTVHRLICETFISNPHKKKQVNHINGIKSDNRVKNLEWCNAKENIAHAKKLGLRNFEGSKSVNAKLTEQQVIEIRSDKINLHKDIAEKYGVEKSLISKIKLRKMWTHI